VRTLVLFFGFSVCFLISSVVSAPAAAVAPVALAPVNTSVAVLPSGGIALRQFALVTRKDVYGRHAQSLFSLEGKAGLGTLFRKDIEAISDKLP